MNKKLKIGLTVTIGDQYQAIWSSGIIQNVYFLYRLFEQVESVSEVFFVDLSMSDTYEKTIEVAEHTCKVINGAAAVDKVDVLIEIGLQVWRDIALAIQSKGGKVVSQRCGNAYIDEVMGMFSPNPPMLPNNEVRYDEIWVIPHYAKNSAPMLRTMYRCPVHSVPYIWSPLFIDRIIHSNPEFYRFAWQPGREKRTVVICEPNLNPTKTFHVPLLACEELYRAHPEKLNHVYAMNTHKLNESPTFLQLAHRLDITQKNVASFEARMDIVTLMSHYGDIVLSHHWENGLNYLYLDALHGGYPLVHNSEYIKDYGYYYETFDCQGAAEQMLRAINEHDQNFDAYKKKGAELIAKFDMLNPENIKTYEALVWNVYQGKSASAQ